LVYILWLVAVIILIVVLRSFPEVVLFGPAYSPSFCFSSGTVAFVLRLHDPIFLFVKVYPPLAFPLPVSLRVEFRLFPGMQYMTY
jgi:hypothetical protein